MIKKLKRWPFLVGALAVLGIFCSLAWAAADAFFAGRALRMTKTATNSCNGFAGYNCKSFDTSNRERFWNGTTTLYTTNSTEGTPTKGKLLVGDGTNWVSVTPGTLGQVLVAEPTDMGGPTGIVWKSPADGGLIPVVH